MGKQEILLQTPPQEILELAPPIEAMINLAEIETVQPLLEEGYKHGKMDTASYFNYTNRMFGFAIRNQATPDNLDSLFKGFAHTIATWYLQTENPELVDAQTDFFKALLFQSFADRRLAIHADLQDWEKTESQLPEDYNWAEPGIKLAIRSVVHAETEHHHPPPTT